MARFHSAGVRQALLLLPVLLAPFQTPFLWLLDYSNRHTLYRAIFTNDPVVQYAASHMFAYGNKSNCITSAMADLYPLPISQRIDFKILFRVFHYPSESSLSYLSKLVSIDTHPQSLLSNNKSQIHQPPCQVSHP